MCVKGGDGTSASLISLDAGPPADSTLASSLKRGYFAQTFGHWEVIGSGGFGTVVKAWHLAEQRWYAVKLVHGKVRAHETIEDNYEAWCGPEVFKQVRNLRSPHVIRYVQYWSELPKDLPNGATECGSKPLSTSRSPAGACQGFSMASDVGLESVRATWAEQEPEGFSVASDGGFEWAAATWAEQEPEEPEESELGPKSADSASASGVSTTESIGQRRYSVVICEQMELCEGVTLATWLAQPGLRPGMSDASHDGILEVFTQIMKGLAELHEVGIVHCDVKPANIMVTKSGIIKFFDFGSARLRSTNGQRQGSRKPPSPRDQEGSCTALGTPGYAPPEHCVLPTQMPLVRQCSADSSASHEGKGRSRLAGPGADIFSAGIVLVELLMAAVVAGPAWLTAMERAKALAQLRTGYGNALPVAVLRQRGIEGWLRQLVLRMVLWDAEMRPSAVEVLDEIEAGIWAASRHNPNVGTQHPRSPQLAAMCCHLSAAHNPYIGYFLDHRRAEIV